MEVKQGGLFTQSVTPISILSSSNIIHSKRLLEPSRVDTINIDSVGIISRSLSKYLEILPTKAPLSTLKSQPIKRVSEIFTPTKKEFIEIKNAEESPVDSILRSQEKLREYSPGVTANTSALAPTRTDESIAHLSDKLRNYVNKMDASIPFDEHILPSGLKYVESVQLGQSRCHEDLDQLLTTKVETIVHEIPITKPNISPLVSSDNDQETPVLTLEDILKDEYILLDGLEKPFEESETAASVETLNIIPATAEARQLSISSIDRMKSFPIVDDDDDTVDSLLINLQAPIPPSPPIMSGDSHYQWASTTPLSEAEYEALRPHLAMKYSFELDYFQRQAIMRLERRESVFVAAHTSAGKTVVAEYAIALSKKHHTRTIYTSPIKALSNQKYRDFRDRFDDVGLITGDVSINPDAACLIMTTEILRSMLYRGSDTIRDIEFVIFDEVHYVNDSERGVVWEEVIIMLPDKINMIFLSATTPNTLEFSDWIGRTKQRKVFVVSTSKRPVPLQHYLFHDDNMFCLMKAEGQFRSEAMSLAIQKEKDKLKPKPKSAENAAMASQRQAEKAAIAAQASGGRTTKVAGRGPAPGRTTPTQKSSVGDIAGGKGQWLSILRILRQGGREAAGGLDPIDFGVGFAAGLKSQEVKSEISQMKRYDLLPESIKSQISRKEYEQLEVRGTEEDDESEGGLLPVVIFCFSKKKCEEIVDYFKGQDLISAKEKSEVRKVMNKVFSRLNPSDARLPQVIRIEEMLLRGFGVHHGGLLPVLKESVELLYSKSVVKVLLATETFAMGVNMPARSVVFNGFRKHDGKGFRDLFPGEYTQMAGRAGRRGKDRVGTVIVAAWTELPSETSIKKLLTGTPTVLSSQFRLTYNMMLNLLRANDLGVEDMMKKSFSEFRMQRALASSDVTLKLRQYEKARESIVNSSVDFSVDESFSDVRMFYQTIIRCRTIFHHMLSILTELKGINELQALFAPGRLVMLHHSGLHSPNILHIGILIGENSSTAIFDPDVKLSSSSLLLNLRHVVAPNLGNSKPRCIFSTKFIWVLILSLGSEDKKHQLHLEKIPLTDVVGILNHKMKIQNNRSDFQDTLSPKDPVLIKRKDDFGLGRIREAAKNLLFPEEELRSLYQDLLTYLSSNVYLGCNIFLDLSAETKLRDFQFCEANSEFLTSARKLTSCQTWSTFGQCLNQSYSFCTLFQTKLNREWKIHQLSEKITALQYYTSNASLALFPDFLQRMKVLDHLGYIENSAQGRTVTLKGRVACEMNTCDELIATEILFFNVLEPLNPPEVAALLSALVFQEKTQESPPLTTRLEVARSKVLTLSKSLQALQDEFGVLTNENEQRSGLNFGLAAPVYQWARGLPFQEIAEMTLTPEGSIVRTITRLDELCKDFRNAARVVGNPSLYRKMEAASQCIKRDIVFAASLYVS